MEPLRVGRLLGAGTRVAANMVRERVEQAAAKEQARPAQSYSSPKRTTLPSNSTLPRPENLRTASRNAARGARGFGRALWNPFAHATSMLWLEVTGLFFGVFTFFFIGNGWKFRHDWQTGPDHRKFLGYSICGLIFLYFTVSSFLRARRKNRLKQMRSS